MRPKMRLAHCSDIHLDNDYYGGERNTDRRDRYREVFSRLLDQLTAQRPDLLLLAGDLFDSNRASEGTILWAMDRLAALPFQVVMIPGNHDCLVEDGIYRRHDFDQIGNLHLIADEAGEHLELDDLPVAVWGRGMQDHCHANQPLLGAPRARAEDRWLLGLGHGIYVPAGETTLHASPIRAEEIAGAGFDYLALGHHHGLMDVSVGSQLAFYSGAPTRMADKQGTYVTVDLDDRDQCRVEIHELY